jgi:hypothetical protein
LFDYLSLHDVAGDAADELITSASIHLRPQLRSIDVTLRSVFISESASNTRGLILFVTLLLFGFMFGLWKTDKGNLF